MGFFWALGGIAAGTLFALLTGAILDYLKMRNVLPPALLDWLFLPYMMGAAGLLSSIIAVSMYSRYVQSRGVGSGKPAAPGKTGVKSAPKGMEHVPGMPVFDVEGIKRGEHKMDTTT
ncbi:MAG: hypothetical protein M3R04_06735, partial [bacterium]|nr:hypothetical protein [bacterium]